MQDVKKGDYITFGDRGHIEEVVARLEDILFTRNVYKSGSFGSLQSPMLIEDLETQGWKIIENV